MKKFLLLLYLFPVLLNAQKIVTSNAKVIKSSIDNELKFSIEINNNTADTLFFLDICRIGGMFNEGFPESNDTIIAMPDRNYSKDAMPICIMQLNGKTIGHDEMYKKQQEDIIFSITNKHTLLFEDQIKFFAKRNQKSESNYYLQNCKTFCKHLILANENKLLNFYGYLPRILTNEPIYIKIFYLKNDKLYSIIHEIGKYQIVEKSEIIKENPNYPYLIE